MRDHLDGTLGAVESQFVRSGVALGQRGGKNFTSNTFTMAATKPNHRTAKSKAGEEVRRYENKTPQNMSRIFTRHQREVRLGTKINS